MKLLIFKSNMTRFIKEPAYLVAVELGHHIFDPCSKFIANLIGLTLEFSQN